MAEVPEAVRAALERAGDVSPNALDFLSRLDSEYFTRVFPHRRLTLDVPLIDIEEWRYPGHGRRRRWRAGDHQVEDQKLVSVREVHRLRTAADLGRLVRRPLPSPFHTGHLAQALGVDRWIAQRIAYCLRKMGSVRQIGKLGNALLYEFPPDGKAGRRDCA